MEQEVTSKQWRRKHWQRPRTEHRRDWKLKGPKREQAAPSPTQVYMSKRKAKEKTPLIRDSDFLVVVWKATKFWLFANGCKAAESCLFPAASQKCSGWQKNYCFLLSSSLWPLLRTQKCFGEHQHQQPASVTDGWSSLKICTNTFFPF